MPARPVAQLALPEFTTTARTRPPVESNPARPTSTGAATTRFFVNNAAALAPPAAAELRSAWTLRLRSGQAREGGAATDFNAGSDSREREPQGQTNFLRRTAQRGHA